MNKNRMRPEGQPRDDQKNEEPAKTGSDAYVLMLLRRRPGPALCRTLEERPELVIYELACSPLGWPSLALAIHLPGRAVVFAQPIKSDWGTSLTNGAEGIVHAAREKFGPARFYEWYFDQDSLDEILFDPASGSVSWRHFTRQRFEALYGLRLPRPLEVPAVQAAERGSDRRLIHIGVLQVPSRDGGL